MENILLNSNLISSIRYEKKTEIEKFPFRDKDKRDKIGEK